MQIYTFYQDTPRINLLCVEDLQRSVRSRDNLLTLDLSFEYKECENANRILERVTKSACHEIAGFSLQVIFEERGI